MATVNVTDSSAVSETLSFMFPPTLKDTTTIGEVTTLAFVWAAIRKDASAWVDQIKH